MRMGRKGSSDLIEFLIALFVGLLAILGGLLCIGFLLVEPLRNPYGQTVPITDICEFSKTNNIITYLLEDYYNILAR